MSLKTLLAFLGLGLPAVARAAELDVNRLGLAWALPFVGMLLSIALLPLLAPRLWHHHQGKVALGWAAALLLPLALTQGPGVVAGLAAHTLVAEYGPFVLLLVALFTISGGIYVRGNLRGTPALNTALMGIGALLASLMGTTGAAMLLIRPLIRANDQRPRQAHVVVFFIFIVANAGGALTPLGDPPLFLGFLKGVDFFWTLRHLAAPTALVVGLLLIVFFLLDRAIAGKEQLRADPTPSDERFGLEGAINFLPLAGVVALVLMSGLWRSEISVAVLGVPVALPSLLRDLGFVAMAGLSLALTPKGVRLANQFSWAPMAEVAKLFIGIFLTMGPVLLMLQAGAEGPFAAVARAVTSGEGQPLPAAYFWLTGALSSFLDNAPTYLVFFNLAGGDAATLMTQGAATLTAISAGAVFMGANTYIGNAPNFMVKAIAEERGIAMPSFFGYMLWSGGVLLPLFVFVTWVFF